MGILPHRAGRLKITASQQERRIKLDSAVESRNVGEDLIVKSNQVSVVGGNRCLMQRERGKLCLRPVLLKNAGRGHTVAKLLEKVTTVEASIFCSYSCSTPLRSRLVCSCFNCTVLQRTVQAGTLG